MKKYIQILFLVLFCTSSFAGSCPMLWNKLDSQINDINDDNLKSKVQKLRDEGKKAHLDGDHANSEKLLNEALNLLAS